MIFSCYKKREVSYKLSLFLGLQCNKIQTMTLRWNLLSFLPASTVVAFVSEFNSSFQLQLSNCSFLLLIWYCC